MVISKNNHTIIWDWNGTLLDDLDLSIRAINHLLERRELPKLTVDRYLEVFAFPVKDYYVELGFNLEKEPFDIPAREFIDIYNHEVMNCSLHKGVIPVLEKLKQAGKQQLVLSAMKQDFLMQTLDHYRIIQFFDEVSGLNDHYANSKVENGKRMFERLQLQPENTCLIGDTIHDFEVARELGCRCILIANGHQSEKRLKKTGCRVIQDIRELIGEE